MLEYNQRLFLQMLAAGLQQQLPASIDGNTKISWDAILNLAKQQTVVGIIADVMSKMDSHTRPDRQLFYQFILYAEYIQRTNERLNKYIPSLWKTLADSGVDALLLKGQGVAICYPYPELRMPGDIDVFVPDEKHFDKARKLLDGICSKGDASSVKKHIAYYYHDIVIELHGEFRFYISPKCSRRLEKWARRFTEPDFLRRKVTIGSGTALLPPLNFDAVFIFAHMAHHFMSGGVGLRQVCDWMMFVQKYCEDNSLDKCMLKQDLLDLGLMKFWQVFASLAVKFLGCPSEKMLFYNEKCNNKADILMDSILKTGNFGTLQKEHQLKSTSNRFLKKVVTAVGQIPVYLRTARLFPLESLYCFIRYSRDAIGF